MNKENGKKDELQEGTNVWIYKNIPINNEQESKGIIFENQNDDQKVILELKFTVMRMEVIGEGCKLEEANKSSGQNIYICKGTLYPQEIYPVLIMHENSYGSYFYRYSISYTIAYHGNNCFNYKLSLQNGSPYDWKVKLGQKEYDCDWFDINPTQKCKNYGDIQGKSGKTSNEVCCACGGGANEQLALMVENDQKNKKIKKSSNSIINLGDPIESDLFQKIEGKISGVIYRKER